ncbi:effector-associated constant component EACC1 [Streptomyces sp. NEAU-174]|uniref:effector-associated constant component EACC1 n=1 Tax=Streptomyces sp. NEAU-174 TaxID=3458254 RepID=UPI0040439DFA
MLDTDPSGDWFTKTALNSTLATMSIAADIARCQAAGPGEFCAGAKAERKEDRVHVRVRMVGDSAGNELRSLHSWLLGDTGARRWAQVEWESARAPAGAMGGALDAVSLVLSSGFSAASLAVSIVQWRTTRGSRGPSVMVERADGSRVTIGDASLEETERLLRLLERDEPGQDEP